MVRDREKGERQIGEGGVEDRKEVKGRNYCGEVYVYFFSFTQRIARLYDVITGGNIITSCCLIIAGNFFRSKLCLAQSYYFFFFSVFVFYFV